LLAKQPFPQRHEINPRLRLLRVLRDNRKVRLPSAGRAPEFQQRLRDRGIQLPAVGDVDAAEPAVAAGDEVHLASVFPVEDFFPVPLEPLEDQVLCQALLVLGELEGDGVPEAVVEAEDPAGIDLAGLLRIGEQGDQADEVLLDEVGDVLHDGLPGDPGPGPEAEEEGVEGDRRADPAHEVLDQLLEEGDVADGEALDHVLVDDDVEVVPEDAKFRGELG